MTQETGWITVDRTLVVQHSLTSWVELLLKLVSLRETTLGRKDKSTTSYKVVLVVIPSVHFGIKLVSLQ